MNNEIKDTMKVRGK